jgi:LuxR family maltose regulon positive regulatory protein
MVYLKKIINEEGDNVSMDKQKNNELYYFPERLIKRLDRILDYPLTLVEAPSGAGKTTAVREYLVEKLPRRVNQYWFTAIGETAVRAWEHICALIAHVDNDTAFALTRLGVPSYDTLGDVARLMQNCRCDVETVLVIDNYQMIDSGMPREIISALSYIGSSLFHIVIITQELYIGSFYSTHNHRILTVGKEELFFERADIDEFFRQAGFLLSPTDLESITQYTEGWVAALQLQMITYRDTGGFENVTNIMPLVRSAIWNRLDRDEQFFLLSLSLMDSFTAQQACVMLDTDKLPPYAETLLETGSFLRYNQLMGEYMIHSLLQEFLRVRFEKEPIKLKKKLWKRAGTAVGQHGLNYKAAGFYYLSGDFEALLSLPLKGNDLTGYLETDISRFFTNILNECPHDTLLRYPVRLLVFAFHLFLVGDYIGFGRICQMLSNLLAQRETSGLSEEEFWKISGEFALLTSFTKFNDIEKMSEGHRTAWKLLSGPTTLYNWDDSWTFRQPSVMYLFWSKKGELSRELDCMDECMPIYTQLTMGHGTAAEYAMRAEALLMWGDDLAAEMLCHKALFLASAKKQGSICCAAEFILARIFLLRGSLEEYKAAVTSMEGRVYAGMKYDNRPTMELAVAFLETTLGSTEGIADWLRDPDTMWKKVFKAAIPFGQMIFIKILLLEGKNAAALGVSDALLLVVEELHFLLPQVYILIFKSIALMKLGHDADARVALNRALDIALPDRVYLPFAEYGELLPLLEKARLTHPDMEGIGAILTLCKRQSDGMSAIKRVLSLMPLPLTMRERDVALLARQGLTNREIADRMFITDDTVKAHLKSIYRKLGIRSRVQLESLAL